MKFAPGPHSFELVFWRMFDHLKGLCPEFASCKYRGFLSRFKERAIHALDSSTIQLTLNCFDWARHRRRKAAAASHTPFRDSVRVSCW